MELDKWFLAFKGKQCSSLRVKQSQKNATESPHIIVSLVGI
jgi:hypothetical protein